MSLKSDLPADRQLVLFMNTITFCVILDGRTDISLNWTWTHPEMTWNELNVLTWSTNQGIATGILMEAPVEHYHPVSSSNTTYPYIWQLLLFGSSTLAPNCFAYDLQGVLCLIPRYTCVANLWAWITMIHWNDFWGDETVFLWVPSKIAIVFEGTRFGVAKLIETLSMALPGGTKVHRCCSAGASWHQGFTQGDSWKHSERWDLVWQLLHPVSLLRIAARSTPPELRCERGCQILENDVHVHRGCTD